MQNKSCDNLNWVYSIDLFDALKTLITIIVFTHRWNAPCTSTSSTIAHLFKLFASQKGLERKTH